MNYSRILSRGVCATLLSIALLSGCARAGNPQAELDEMINDVALEFSDIEHIATSSLADWLSDPGRVQPQLLDVREKDEYAVSHLPGAIRVDSDAQAEELLSSIDPARPVVLYCSVGYRSSHVARRLQVAGLKVLNLEGSVFKWANEGRSLVSEKGSTSFAHPYNDSYGRMLREDIRSYR